MCCGPKNSSFFDKLIDQFIGVLAVVLMIVGFVVAMLTLYPLGKLEDWWKRRS